MMTFKHGDRVQLKEWRDPDDGSVTAPAEVVTILGDGPHNGCYFCRDENHDYMDVPEDQVIGLAKESVYPRALTTDDAHR